MSSRINQPIIGLPEGPTWHLAQPELVHTHTHSHCYGDQQHIETLEEYIATVAGPDVSGENHQVEGTAAHSREGAQCQLTPLMPVHLCEANTIGCSST